MTRVRFAAESHPRSQQKNIKLSSTLYRGLVFGGLVLSFYIQIKGF